MASPSNKASCSQREINPSMFTPKTPHFFKIILEDTIRHSKLRFPRKFVTKYGDSLSSPVLLMVPSGSTWHVELIKSDGDVWLQNGWKEFAEHYSLKHGHFLVFKYQGDCNFQVLIFDMSASEIEYPHISPNMDRDEVCQEPNKEEDAKDDSVEVLYETPRVRKTRQNSQTPCLRPRKILRRTALSDKYKRDCEDVSSGEGYLKTKVPRGRHAFGDNENATALQRASAFKSENFFFVVEMQPSYINPGRKLCLPSSFITKCLKEKVGDVTLCTLDGKTWPAKYCCYLTNNKYTKAALHCGWTAFMQDNKLELGDVCVFELIEQTKILLKVIIYRGGLNSLANCDNGRLSTQGSTKSRHLLMPPLSSHEKARAMLRASSFRSENPFFKVVMQPAYLGARCSVNIPYKFAKRHVDEKEDRVILQVSDGRRWIVKFSVKVTNSGQRKARFYDTWRAFAQDNNLEVGDVCVFELINRDETSFEVSIF
ncbi:hypothetical protein SCA6_012929 [Theobroma cacao]